MFCRLSVLSIHRLIIPSLTLLGLSLLFVFWHLIKSRSFPRNCRLDGFYLNWKRLTRKLIYILFSKNNSDYKPRVKRIRASIYINDKRKWVAQKISPAVHAIFQSPKYLLFKHKNTIGKNFTLFRKCFIFLLEFRQNCSEVIWQFKRNFVRKWLSL